MSLPHTLHIGRPDGVINWRMPLRLLLVNLSLLALCLAMAVAALCYGTLQLSLGQVFAALSGEAPKNLVTVVTQWRLPRIAMALLLGGALGMSGAIFQSIIRNPLGSPDVIGFNMGAYTGALIAITLFNGGYYYIAGGALAGGILSALAIYLLAWRQGIAGFRLIIVGIAISAVLVSTNTWLIITASRARHGRRHVAGRFTQRHDLAESPARHGVHRVGGRGRAADGQTAAAAGNGRRHGARTGRERRRQPAVADAVRRHPHRRRHRHRRADFLYRAGGAADRPPPGRTILGHPDVLGADGATLLLGAT